MPQPPSGEGARHSTERKRMSNRKAWFVGLPLAGLVALGAWGWYSQRAPSSGATAPVGGSPSVASPAGKAPAGPTGGFAVQVETARVATAALQDDVSAVGTLRSNESVVVRPEISGRIEQLGFREGAPVTKGQVIVRLDDAVPAAEVAQARANLALAESSYNRTQQLQKENYVSATASDQALNGLRVAQANVQLAEAKLAKTRIVAPFAGIIGIRRVSIGDYIKEGQDLVTLEDVSSLKVDFRLPEQLLATLRPGQSVEIASDALPGRRYAGSVEAIDPLIDQNGRAVVLRARLKNADGQLRPGMFVRTRIILEERANALTIPEEAIVPVGADQYVFRVVDGKAQRVKVATGLRRDGRVEIVGGLGREDVVVTAGQLKVRDGSMVATGGGKPAAAPVAGDGKSDAAPAAARSGG
jgi:membrane fusion protein (multidrug efflux system)